MGALFFCGGRNPTGRLNQIKPEGVKVNLKKLNIKNFKGVKSFDLEASGDVDIFGDNETGKTTLFDAVT